MPKCIRHGIRHSDNILCGRTILKSEPKIHHDYTSTGLLLLLGPRRKERGPLGKSEPPLSPRSKPPHPRRRRRRRGGDARPAAAPGEAGGRGGGLSESRQAPGPPGAGPAEPPLPHVSCRPPCVYSLPLSPCSVKHRSASGGGLLR